MLQRVAAYHHAAHLHNPWAKPAKDDSILHATLQAAADPTAQHRRQSTQHAARKQQHGGQTQPSMTADTATVP